MYHLFVIHSWSLGFCSNRFCPLFKKNSIRSNGCCYSCEKKFSSIGMAEVICSKKPSSVETAKTICLKKNGHASVRKKSAAVRTADVIHLKETALLRTANVSRLGNSIQLFKQLLLSVHTKLISRSVGQQYMMGFKFPNRWDYLFRRNFIQLSEWLCSFETKSQPI